MSTIKVLKKVRHHKKFAPFFDALRCYLCDVVVVWTLFTIIFPMWASKAGLAVGVWSVGALFIKVLDAIRVEEGE